MKKLARVIFIFLFFVMSFFIATQFEASCSNIINDIEIAEISLDDCDEKSYMVLPSSSNDDGSIANFVRQDKHNFLHIFNSKDLKKYKNNDNNSISCLFKTEIHPQAP